MLKPRYEGNETILTYVTDDQGKVILDNPCPVGCGKCCGYWQGVKALSSWAKTDRKRCPYLKKYGCQLDRKKRPIECKAYICELGILAISNLISPNEVEIAISEKVQDIAFTFFHKFPEIHKAKIGEIFLDECDKKLLEKFKNLPS